MSSSNRSNRSNRSVRTHVDQRAGVGFFSVLFVLCALTGRCHAFGCGFDRDYIGEAVGGSK